MVECPLRMRKAPGSNPGASKLFFHLLMKSFYKCIIVLVLRVCRYEVRLNEISY